VWKMECDLSLTELTNIEMTIMNSSVTDRRVCMCDEEMEIKIDYKHSI
jgi:hypothetical protein